MTMTLAFDVYGTLIDTQGVVSKLKTIVGPKANDFSQLWRNKQLEYSFRRGLMREYAPFSVCTAHALDYACLHYNILLSENQKQVLLDAYSTLPAFDDVKESLQILSDADVRLYAFSNGAKKAVSQLLNNAGVHSFFLDIISVEDVNTFKPSPDVYQHLLKKTHSLPEDTWLISSNPFDILGALSSGLKAAWVKRSKDAVFDPWGKEPTRIISTLRDLHKQ